jgi:hypothetical protein
MTLVRLEILIAPLLCAIRVEFNPSSNENISYIYFSSLYVHIVVLWVAMSFSLIDAYQCFGKSNASILKVDSSSS